MSLLERVTKPRYGRVRTATYHGRKPFQRILSHSDWWRTELETVATTITCPARKWTRIGEFTIPPQQKIYFGYGNPNDWMNQGFIHLAIFDTTTPNSRVCDGVVRLRQMDANETMIITVYEGRTEVLRGDPNDKMKMIPLPIQDHVPDAITYEDCKLVIDFEADTAVDVARTAVGTAAGLDIWNIPVSVFHVK